MTALEKSGLHVPEDMSVIGCDDISLYDLPSSRILTTASLARHELGRQAAQTLEALMTADGDTEPRVIPVTPPPAGAGGFSLCRVGVATDQPGP